ncbi:MAG: CocE/NonD family hydrolase [Planctomycetota bacterium]
MPERAASAAVVSLLVTALAAQESRPGLASWRVEQRDLAIEMRDGKSLAADLFLPGKRGRYPAVLIQTPYNKKHLGAPISLGRSRRVGEIGRGAVSDTLGLLDRAHYAYLVVDWRGFYASKKAMRGVQRWSWRRGQDGHDLVEWIAKQPWSDGKVGTWGGSALGKQQFSTALEHPPHLVCCVPLIAAMGIGYEQYFENGVPLDAHLRILDLLGYDVRERVRKNPLPGTLLWRLAARRTYRPQEIEVPCLLISGWWDHYPDLVIRTFEDIVARGGDAARAHSKLLIGPWDHVGVGLRKQGDLEFPKAELASAEAAKAFLDYHLRGVRNGWEKTPRIRYFDSGSREWRAAERWTGAKRPTRRLFLHAGGSIDASPPGEAPEGRPGERSYRYDPRKPPRTLGGANLPPLPHGPRIQNELLARKDLLVYRTGPLAEALPLEGRLSLTFSFRADRADCDFCVWLCDVDPKGRAFLLCDSALRAKLRNGKVEPLEPGTAYRVTLSLPDHCHTFEKDHELLLVLASGNSPRYERNPHTGQDLWDPKTALDLAVTILHRKDAPAVLEIPLRRGR